jgi:hypothetical protein
MTTSERGGSAPVTPEPATCAECGHLHFLGVARGYGQCPIEGCDCRGQHWYSELYDAVTATLEHERDSYGEESETGGAILRVQSVVAEVNLRRYESNA